MHEQLYKEEVLNDVVVMYMTKHRIGTYAKIITYMCH